LSVFGFKEDAELDLGVRVSFTVGLWKYPVILKIILVISAACN